MEYKVVKFNGQSGADCFIIQNDINKFAKEGWKLEHVFTNNYKEVFTGTVKSEIVMIFSK